MRAWYWDVETDRATRASALIAGLL